MAQMIFKLVSGEYLIGRIDEDKSENIIESDIFEVTDPQWIVSEPSGTMKLRDGLMLTNDISFPIHMKDVLTWFRPSKPLSRYYAAAVEYSKLMRTHFDNQTEDATDELVSEVRQMEIEQSAARSLNRLRPPKGSLN